jgi:branched-chain amino acid transport system permease protein
MTLPSLALLTQAVLSGIFVGALYGLLGLGLSLSWGLLRQINLSHFALAFLGAYLTYQLVTVAGMDPLLTLLVIVPCFFVAGAAIHRLLDRFAVTPLNSMLVTFGMTVIVESIIQWYWTADFRRMASRYADITFRAGPAYLPLPEVLTLALALLLCFAVWATLRYTDLGRALRAAAEDAEIATAFGVNQRTLAALLSGACAALAAVAGLCLALSYTLTPSQMYAWIGVVFAVVMIGGLGSAIGPLVAGIVIGVAEALTMAITAPSWAPLVSFSLLILVLLVRRGRA